MYKTYVTKIIVNSFLCINLFKEHSKFVLMFFANEYIISCDLQY